MKFDIVATTDTTALMSSDDVALRVEEIKEAEVAWGAVIIMLRFKRAVAPHTLDT